jgi:hypothetical protein
MNKTMLMLTIVVGCIVFPSCSSDATQPAGETGPASNNATTTDNEQPSSETGLVAGLPRLANERLLMIDDDRRVAEAGPGMVRLSPDAKYMVYISRQAQKISAGSGDEPPYELFDRITVRNVESGKDKLLPVPAFPAEFLAGVLPLCTFDATGTKIVVPAGLDDNSDGFHSMEKEIMQAISEASNALAGVGPAAIPSLIQLLQEKTVSGNTRVFAARALGKIRPVDKEVISVLTDALKGPDEESNRWAAEALGEIGPAAVPSLVEILDDGKPIAKYWAAAALQQMGSVAEPAIPALVLCVG